MTDMKDIPLWLLCSHLQTRFEMRWAYRWLGQKVPRMSWEKDDTEVNKLEAYMDREELMRV